MSSRFVVQEHTTPEGVHWDLMLEKSDVLTTFRLEQPPEAALDRTVGAVRICDHPLRFLTYEGPVQKGTGSVKIVDCGTCDASDEGEDVITLELEGENGELVRLLEAEPWVRRVTGHDSQVTLTVEMGERKVPEVIALSERHGIHVLSVNLRRPSLEDVFLHFTGTTMRQREVSAVASRKELITMRMRTK